MNRVVASRQGAFGRVCLNAFAAPLAPHAHAEAHFVIRVDGSPVAMRVAGVDVTLGHHRIAAVGPLLPHDVRVGTEAARVPARALVLYLDDAEFGRLAPRPRGEGGASVEIDAATRALADRVAEALGAGQEQSDDARLDIDLGTLVVRCADALRAVGGTGRRSGTGGSVDARVYAAVLMLRDGLGRPDDVARRVGLSRPHFYRLFREHVGMTPGDYLDALRADAAIGHVADTARSMTDIGEELGFASQASFTRFFRAHVGMPPMAYRRCSPGALDAAYLRLSGIRRRALRARIGACAMP